MTAVSTPLPDNTPLGEVLKGLFNAPGRITTPDGTPISPATADGIEAVRALLATPVAPAGSPTAGKQDAIKASVDALAPYLDGLEPLLTAIGGALAGTLAVSAASLPLPAGAATSSRQDAALAASKATAITPSDTADLAAVPVALYVGTGGDLSIQGTGDTGPVLWKSVPSGSLLPMRVKRVYATNTTASNILAVS